LITNRVTGLTISADGKHLASSDEGGTVYMWNLINKQAIKTILTPPSSTSKGKISNISFWLGDPETLKGGKKPLVAFPDVPKLIESNEDERQEREHVITVWNRFEQISPMHIDSESQFNGNYDTSSSSSSGSMAEINSLKVKLAKCEEINQKLHEYCVENLLGESAPLPKKTKHNK
jgi:WD40 repeat protein